ncbi:hypothetical protein GCM10011385_18570 [Nitratireductor aestuarii]|uniref:Hypersensitivity response secretion-like HrpJ domain-containing protein n=1 Tax=Nitratireductor aestuarii TaxID=1735103 RepID=A0A916RR17_9HYPH|nr:HrpJ domain-containing protein [Nitratireductor aestuarii]GGA65050.1 hypothetical protein GCM10011385_18570 [Nitratireductor aestuarii]
MVAIDFPSAAKALLPSLDDVKTVRGTYMDEAVALETDPGTQMVDLAEEIGMAVAYRGDRRLLEGRRLRTISSLHERILERIARYRRDLPHLPGAASIQRLLERLVALEPRLSGDHQEDGASELLRNVQAELQAYDPDVTHQYVALKLVLQHLEGRQIDLRLRRALQDLRAGFDEAARKRDVRAGFAAAIPASKAAAIGGDPASVRAAYRLLIADAANIAQIFHLLRRFDLKRRFRKVIGIFIRAAARDLASTGPSTDRGYIRALMSELDRLRKAKSVVLMSAELMDQTNRHLDEAQRVEDGEMDLAEDMLSFACKERPGYADARELMRLHEVSPMAAKLVFANGLRDLHGELPAAVSPSSKAYLAQRAAILRMLEMLVEQEEEELQVSEAGSR